MKRLSYILRSLLRSKGASLTKITSLTIGLSAGILAFGYCVFETDYDSFHRYADRTYRIDYHVPLALMEEINREIPEIERITSLSPRLYPTYQYQKRQIHGGEIRQADTSFFQLFSFRLLSGDPHALQDANKLFISEKLAQTIFGKENPVGKEIIYNDKPLTVAGVYENFPRNSFLMYTHALHSLAGVTDNTWEGSWENYSGYIRLSPQAHPNEVARKIQAIVDRHQSQEQRHIYTLQPLKDLHLKYGWGYSYIFLVGFMGLTIVLISALNYILIAVSSLVQKTKEIGIHKINGASNLHIFTMFFWETVILTLIAGLLASGIIIAFRPFFEYIMYNEYTSLFNARVLTATGIFLLFMILLTGGLPARLFASVPVLQIFRQISQGRRSWKYALLWVQFFSACMLLTLLLVFNGQYKFLMNKDLGYDIKNLYYTYVNCGSPYPSMFSIKEEAKRFPFVTDATFVHTLPLWAPKTTVYDNDKRGLFESCYLFTDRDFFHTLQIPLTGGDTNRIGQGKNDVWVNEKFQNKLEATQQAKNRLLLGNRDIIPQGTCRDFQVASLYALQLPLVVLPLEEPDSCRSCYLLIKSTQMTPQNAGALMNKLKEISGQPNLPLYYYLYAHQQSYGSEKDMCTTVETFTYLALIIAFLGLFGFTGDEISRRTKEIAIRKVSGASVLSITLLMLRNICILALCALPFGLAGAYFMGSFWLNEFAYRIPLSIWIFLGGAAATFTIILLTVLLKSQQGIHARPAEALKSE